MARSHAASRILAVVVLTICFVLAFPLGAFAFNEPNSLPGVPNPAQCLDCHWDFADYVTPCIDCHGGSVSDSSQAVGFEFDEPWGPHGGYAATTHKCAACHQVHDATADVLLPAATVHGTCFTCHDGTGGWGVYGTLRARDVPVGASHSYDATMTVPGGDATTGGSSTVVFKGTGSTLTCTDCHSVHGQDVVTAFVGDRMRMRQSVADYSSTKLLRRSPTGASAPVNDYGSEWCIACHKGRNSMGAVNNHPVETAASVAPLVPFVYSRVALLASEDSTSATVVGSLGGITIRGDNHGGSAIQIGSNNRGYLMPYPRTTGADGQSGHGPLCQQCHEDTRRVGSLSADGTRGDADPASVEYADSVTWNGSAWVTSTNDNPRFQNFPHETENDNMVVETGDDLCLNCHPPIALP